MCLTHYIYHLWLQKFVYGSKLNAITYLFVLKIMLKILRCRCVNLNNLVWKQNVLLVSQTTAFKVIYDSHKYLFNYSWHSQPEVPVILHSNDAGLIITSHTIYIFWRFAVLRQKLNRIFVYVQQFSGFYNIITRFSISKSVKFILCCQA